MPTCWIRPNSLRSHLDPFHAILPPGIYAEDQASYDALLASPDMERTAGSLVTGSLPLRIATPEQAAVLRMLPNKDPAEHLAEERAEYDALSAKISRLAGLFEGPGRQAEKPRARKAVPAPYRLPVGRPGRSQGICSAREASMMFVFDAGDVLALTGLIALLVCIGIQKTQAAIRARRKPRA